jgi:hypothetical protein
MGKTKNPVRSGDERISWPSEVGKLGELWCDFMHDAPKWPIHGQYECGSCGRHRPVPWAQSEVLHASHSQQARA